MYLQFGKLNQTGKSKLIRVSPSRTTHQPGNPWWRCKALPWGQRCWRSSLWHCRKTHSAALRWCRCTCGRGDFLCGTTTNPQTYECTHMRPPQKRIYKINLKTTGFKDLLKSGFKINVPKSSLQPTQVINHLGFQLNLQNRKLQMPPRKSKP